MERGIRAVAKDAGTSVATVSRCLNGGPVSAEVRTRIENSVKKFGYVPDPAARALRLGKSRRQRRAALLEGAR